MAGSIQAFSSKSSHSKPTAIAPSPRVLQAALSGLMAAGAIGCSDSDDSKKADSVKSELSDEELKAACSDMVAEARKTATGKAETSQPDLDAECADRVKEAKSTCESTDTDKLCKDAVAEAKSSCPAVDKPDTAKLCADPIKEAVTKATTPKTAEDKTISAEQKEFTFAELTKTCDGRGGYVEVHAACGGHNSCQGFSYGDWGPGAAMLTEHSCTGVNGCAGLSCVVPPEEKNKDKTGAELYDLKFGDNEPSSCSNCHADYADHDNPDLKKFMVYVLEGSNRTDKNWLDRTAAEQERVVAFGAHSVLPDGTALNNMDSYRKVLSRKEIERVVAHLRTLTPVIKVIKTKDPAPGTPTSM
jgi:hypothetical protein